MKKLCFLLYMSFCFCLCSCFLPSNNSKNISVVNWNVQTFFDANKDGDEYTSFSKSSVWGIDSYKVRLERLCSCIKVLDADIFVFEEIEKSDIMYDISNQLVGNIWNSKKNWGYSCFFKNKGEAIGCALLSRYPIMGFTVHNLDIRTEDNKQPPMRAIMEIKLLVNQRELIILANHWKSKSGNALESDIWRIWQESVLAERFYENKLTPVLACGDFNKDISEFEVISDFDFEGDRYQQNIRLKSIFKNDCSVYSPWIQKIKNEELYVEPGSYYYKGEWGRIDNFFSSDKVYIASFSPRTDGAWVREDFTPNPYRIYTGTGFSDHLPIECHIELLDD